MKRLIAFFMSIGWVFVASYAHSITVRVEVNEQRNVHMASFIVEGRGEYPYPIKTDRVNMMLARRLAIIDGYRQLMKSVDMLTPYVTTAYRPVVVEDFLPGAASTKQEFLPDDVRVEIEYLFEITPDQYARLKKDWKDKVIFEEIESFTNYRHIPRSDITKDFWIKLKGFERDIQ